MKKIILLVGVLFAVILNFTACDVSVTEDERELLVESLEKNSNSNESKFFGKRLGMLKYLKEELEVTDEQAEQIKAIVKESMQAAKEKYKGQWKDMTREERKEIRDTQREEVQAKIKEVLTEEQWTKLEERKSQSPDPARIKERMEARFEKLKEKLNLTSEQEEKVKELFAKRREERMELSREERKVFPRENREEIREDLAEILTDEQLQILDEWKKERREEMKKYGGKFGRRNKS
ncbi:MAG: hypothetical protein PVH88_05050 [Ignavibacteria bacterium]